MRRPALSFAILALVALTVFAHAPSLRNGFIWDDDDHFTQNPEMARPEGLHRLWTSLQASRYYPLTLTNFWIQRRLWGLNPWPYHTVNLLMHSAGAALAFLALRRLNVRGAWVGAALWAVHPVTVESVAWITELKNTQSGVFFFGTILCFLRFERGGRRHWYAAALVCFIAALLSKPSTVVLPLVLLLCAWWQRGKIERKDVELSLPFFALAAVMSVLTIVEQRGHFERGALDLSLHASERLAIAVNAICFYAFKLVWPFQLSFIYPRWKPVDESVLFLMELIGIVLVVAFLWRDRRKRWARTTAFGLLYFAIGLLPVLSFVDIYFFRYSFVADHFQYLASLGLIALIVAGASILFRSLMARVSGTAIALAFLISLSWARIPSFQDDETLWRKTLETNPGAFVAANNLGVISNQRNDYAQSEKFFLEALRLKPDFLEALNNLGLSLTEQKRYQEAEQTLQEALRIKPDFNKTHYCLGHLYYLLHRTDEAEQHLYLAVQSRTDPPMAEAFFDLGSLLQEQQRNTKALECYRIALEMRPDYAMAHNNLAILLAGQGKIPEAIRHYESALKAAPSIAEIHYNFAVTLNETGNLAEAIGHFRKAIELKPAYSNAYLGLGKALAENFEYREAIQVFRQGLEVDPRHMIIGDEMAWIMATAPDSQARNAPQAILIGERLVALTEHKEPKPLDTLAAAYAETGRYAEAIAVAREALTLASDQCMTNLAATIDLHLKYYENHQPFRLP